MKKQAIALLLSILLFSAVSCGGVVNKVDNSSDTVEICVYSAGYGIDWLKEMEKKFEEQTNYKLEIKVQGTDDAIESMIKAGGDITSTDLFIVSDSWGPYISLGAKAVEGYDVCFESLDDVYNSVPSGETRTVKEKMWDSFSDVYKFEVEEDNGYAEHYYAMPWVSGLCGLFYNKKLFADCGLTKTPRTTNELISYCKTLKEKGVTPIIFDSASDYIEYLAPIWWTQYSTKKGVDNFYMGKTSDDAIPSATSSLNIYDDEGLYEMFRVYEDWLNPANGFVDNYAESYEYTKAQARFLTGTGGAIMPNGDWLENEMKNTSSKMEIGNILPMRTPIISAIVDKLSFWTEQKNYSDSRSTLSEVKKTEYDEKLSQIVDYVDGLTTNKPSFATESDINIISEARKVVYSVGALHSAVIPIYSTAKTAAKAFLVYMTSNEALNIYASTTSGSLLPYDFNLESWDGYDELSDFAKVKNEIITNSDYTHFLGLHKGAYCGIDYRFAVNKFSVTFGSYDTTQLKTAKEVCAYNKTYMKNRIANCLKLAGYIV